MSKYFKFSIYNYQLLILLLLLTSLNYSQNKLETDTNFDSLFEFRFANDFIFNTDIYFTNGLFFQFFSPSIKKNPLNAVLLPYGTNAKVFHGISLIQNIYTPIEKSDSIITTDRPFAAYLLLQSTRISLYNERRMKLTSTLKVGVLGPPAFGEEMQNGIHSLLPTSSKINGWQNQIKFDIMLNYFVQYEKGIVKHSFFDLDYLAFVNLGAPYTNLGSGINIRIGEFSNYYETLEISKQKSLQYFMSLNSNLKFVIYDAALQGGFFDKSSVHTIDSENIERFVITNSLFAHLNFNSVKIKAGAVFVSREFNSAIADKWGVLSIVLGF